MSTRPFFSFALVLVIIGSLIAGCGHGSALTTTTAPTVPFTGTWTRHWMDAEHNSGRRVTFAFAENGTGTMTLVIEGKGGATQAHPFTWHKDGSSVNIVYPEQTDRDAWSVSDDGANLTLTDSSGQPDVYQKVK